MLRCRRCRSRIRGSDASPLRNRPRGYGDVARRCLPGPRLHRRHARRHHPHPCWPANASSARLRDRRFSRLRRPVVDIRSLGYCPSSGRRCHMVHLQHPGVEGEREHGLALLPPAFGEKSVGGPNRTSYHEQIPNVWREYACGRRLFSGLLLSPLEAKALGERGFSTLRGLWLGSAPRIFWGSSTVDPPFVAQVEKQTLTRKRRLGRKVLGT